MARVIKKLRWWTVAGGLLLLLPVWFGLLLLGVSAYSVRSDPSPADAAIVLGAAVWDAYPSPVLEERIKHAIALYREGRVGALIFTGGLGPGDRLAESEAARAYALANGVPGGHIYSETVSANTYENLAEAKKIVDRQGFKRILIVSDPLHMKRAVVIAKDLKIDAYPSPTPTSRYRTRRSKLRFLLQETYSYAWYLLRRFSGIHSTVRCDGIQFLQQSCITHPCALVARTSAAQIPWTQ